MTLADQLLALCAEHGLTNLSVDITVRPDGTHYFGSYAHRDGQCGSASVTRETTSAVISESIANVLTKCGRPLIDVPVLEAA